MNSREIPRDTPCGYCFQEWACEWDHIVPRSHGGSNSKENLYPTCKRCNRILSGQLFESLQAKRDYVRQWMVIRGEWT